MAILTSGFITIKDFNDITSSPTAPTSPVIDQVWLDTSVEPPVLKTWNGSGWVETNGVTIGGRNLLRNTALVDESFFTFAPETKLDKNMKNGSNNSIKYQTTVSDSTVKIGATPQPQPVVFGEYYSASAEIYLPATHGMKDYDMVALEVQCFNSIGGLITSYMTYGDKKTIGKWTKLKLENQVMPVGTAEATARVVVQGKATLWVSNLQLERGSKASDWTPCPEDVTEEINDAKIKAEEAEKNAQLGLDEAREANKQLSDMASDSILTPSEKQTITRTWEEIKVEKPLINKQAEGYKVSTTAYDSAFNTLQTYVNTLGLDLTTNTDIAPVTFNAKFNDYYTERQLVLNKIAEESKKQAEDYTDSALEGVVVGGRNFLKYSDLSKSLVKSLISTRGSSHSISIDTNTKYMDKNTLKIVASTGGGNNQDVCWISVLGSQQGTGTGRNLLFSFYAKADRNVRLKARVAYGSYKTDAYVDITTTWERHVIDISEIANANASGEVIFHLTSAGTVWMTMAQLEDGTKVTDWTKAIEDYDDDMLDILQKAEEAEANAQKGIEQAEKAKDRLDEIADDSKLTATEKQQIARDWEEIKVEKESIVKQANVYGVSTTNYVNAYNTLSNYINGLSLNSQITTTINKNTFNSTFNSYYSQRQTVLNDIATKTKEYANTVVDGVVIGGTNLMTDSTGNLGSWSAGSIVDGYMGNKAYRVRRTTTGNSARQQLQKYVTLPSLNVGDSYTLSGWIFIDEDVTLNTDNNQLYMRCYRKGSDNLTDICINNIPKSSPKGQWFRVEATSKLTISDIDVNRCMVSMALGDAGSIRYSMIKLERGTKASDWSPANEDLTNAYSIMLSNEAQVIPTYNDRTPMTSQTYSTKITVYQGVKERTDFTIGSVSNANGITVSKNDTNKAVSFAVNTGTKLTADNGEFNIPITVDGKTFNKVFSWAVAKQGVQGDSAQTVTLSGEQVFKYTNNFTGVPTPSSIKIQASVQNISNPTYVWEFRRAGETAWSTITSATNANQNYYTLPHDNSTIFNSSSVKSVTIRCKVGDKYDELTIVKVSDGAQGAQGVQGEQGKDAYTVILTNETHTFPASSTGNIASAISTTSDVVAYKGATSVTPTIGNITNPSGMTITKSGSGTRLTFQANAGTSLTNTGSVTIPVTVDGHTFSKVFSWSKAKEGVNAKSADIVATGQVFKSSDGGATYTPSAITLTPSLQNVSFSNWQYSATGTGSWTTVVSGQNGLTINGNALAISKDSPLFTKTQTSMVFRLNTNDSSIYDTMTVVKLNDMAEVVIGGRNLISKNDVTTNSSSGSFDSATNTWNLTATAGAGGTWGCGLVIRGENALVPYGKSYVLSFEIKVPRNCSWNADVNNYAASGSSWSGNDNDEGAKRKTSSKSLVANQWVKCWILWANTSSSNTNKVDLYDNTNFGVVMKDDTSDMTFQIRNVKGELGTVPTDWSPAPVDIAKDISTAQNAAASAQNTANSAKTEATNATNKLNEIASDSKLTASEKQQVSRDWEEIKLEKPSIINQANVYSISTTAFTNAYTALETYVGTLNLTSTVTTTITPSDFKSKFNTYYTQRQAILDEVAKKAKKHADDLVANVNIGGRNLARKGSVVKYNSGDTATTVNDANFTIDGSATISRTAVINEGAMIDRYVVYDGGVNYVATFKMRTTSGTVNSINFHNGRGHRNSKVYIDGAYKGTMGQDLTFPNDTNYHKVEVQFEAVATDSATANAQNTSHIIPQPMKGTASAYTVQILNLKIERGNKPTDWSPAPEDTTATIDGLRSDVETMISGVQDQVDGKVETFYQADDPASAWTTTDLKNAHKGDIWYKTTDNMTYRYSGTGWVKLADGDAKSAKDLASSKKRVFTATPTVPYDVGDLWVTALNETGDLKVCKTARTTGSYTASDWVKATDYIDSTQAGNIAQGKVDAQTQTSIFNKLTNNGATQGIFLDGGKIWINGEYVKANSITADRLSISDFTNYAQLNNNTATKYGFTKGADETGGAWLKRNSMARDIFISDYYSCNGGESFRIKYDITTTIKGNSTSGGTDSTYRGTAIGLYCYDGAGASVGIVYSTRYSNQTVSGSSSTVTIPKTARKFRVFIQTESYGNWSGELKVRNIQVTKMAGGELIVDGSVTASKIAAKTITADKLHADVLSANSIVSTINGGSTNISGNKIRTGTIQSNNGKSTINLDNGSMNLGATSDASYLQWTGSALNIKANSINIGTSSVATTTDITNKINNIKIGGTNLIKKKSGYTNGYLSSSNGSISNTGSLNSNQDFYTNDYFPLKTGESICFTSYPKPTVNSSIKAAVYIHVYDSSKVWQKAIYHDTNTANATANKIYTATENCYIRFCSRGFNDYNHMAEYATKPSQWSPAPEDTETILNSKANSETVYTKTETDNKITAAKNEISQSVSDTYETKTNVTTKLASLTVSGVNRALKTQGESSTLTLNNTSNQSWSPYHIANDVSGKKVVIAFDYVATDIVKASGANSQFQSCFTDTNGTTQWYPSFKFDLPTGSGSGTIVSSPIAFGNIKSGTQAQFRFRFDNMTGKIKISKARVFVGEKDLGWSPAPEDVETTVSTIEKRVTSAESKITDTAITNTVKKNFYTKTETDNQITSKGYQTESQVQQTVNNLQIKFAESGGYNLFLNSGFKKNMSYWGTHTHNSPTGGSIGITTSAGEWGFPDASVNCVHIRLSNQSGIEYGISQTIKTTIGKKYTISFYYAGHRLSQANVIVRNSNGSWLANKYISSFPSGGNGSANNWSKCTLTFTASATSHTINIAVVNVGDNAYMWIAKPQVVEGELDLPYSPNPSEVYDGIIQMDKDGIKVSTSNGGWTDFTSLGMNVYNKSSQLSLGTRNGGLTYHGGGQYLGFTSASILDAHNVRGISISTATGGAYLTLGYSSATDPFGGFTANPCLSVAKQDIGDSSSFYRKGVNVHTSLNLNTQNTNRAGTINFGTNNTSKIFESSANNLCMFGNDGVALGYYEGSSNVTKFKITEGSSSSTSYIDSYANWRFNQWNLTDVGQLEVVSRLKMLGTSSLYFNANATHPSVMWHASGDGKLKIFGDNGVDIGYREGDTNRPIFKITEGEDGAYRLQSFSHWHFNNWNLDYVGNVHAQKFTIAGTSGSYYITKGTGDGADYTTYGCLFYTHNGLAFTANGGSVTVVVQGRSGRIMGKNAYYVNSSKCLKSDIRAVTSESEPMPVNLKQGEVVDETLTMEMIGDFIDTIGIRTYITDFEQEGATQRDVDPQQGHVLNLGYIADDLAHHPVFKYIGEKTPDNLYAINSNSLTTVALAGLQAERKERRKLEQRLQQLEAMLLKGEE